MSTLSSNGFTHHKYGRGEVNLTFADGSFLVRFDGDEPLLNPATGRYEPFERLFDESGKEDLGGAHCAPQP